MPAPTLANPVRIEPSKSPSAAILSARNVFKTYRLDRVDVPVLKGASIEVGAGAWVAILGASGSGKSTLMHLLGGLDRPDKDNGDGGGGGEVFFQGRTLGSMSVRELDRYRNASVGFVFQFYHLLPELTVLENAMIPAMVLHGRLGFTRRRGEITGRAQELLKSFGLGHRLGHRPAQLSGGERQRVAIARALINDPPVLLADEPTGNLDRHTGEAILELITRHRGETGRTLVMVTHDPEVAARADRIVRLDDGRVV